MSKTKIDYKDALSLAERIVAELEPATDRIEIAGSIRRRKATVGDIEIVCIPKLARDLFGNPGDSLLDGHLTELIRKGRILRGDKWGPKYRKFHVPAKSLLGIDLFITTPAEWGYTLTIRTGCADFSRLLVTLRQHGGFLPGHLRVGGCRLWENGKALDTSEEELFLAALGLPWVEPSEREEGKFERYLKTLAVKGIQ